MTDFLSDEEPKHVESRNKHVPSDVVSPPETAAEEQTSQTKAIEEKKLKMLLNQLT